MENTKFQENSKNSPLHSGTHALKGPAALEPEDGAPNQEMEHKADQSVDIFFDRLFNKIWSLIKHPVTQFGIAIIGILLALLIFLLSREKREPVFSVAPPELIAQTIKGEKKLQILWNGREIRNVASVVIGIWNNGSRFLDKNEISSDNPIRIVPDVIMSGSTGGGGTGGSTEETHVTQGSPPAELGNGGTGNQIDVASLQVNILAVEVLRTSRPSLIFDTAIETDKHGWQSVVIRIKGDDALEKFDGGLFHILFSGPSMSWRVDFWNVDGRIKGIPKGFQRKSWEKIRQVQNELSHRWLYIGFAAIFLILIFAVVAATIDRYKRSGNFEWKLPLVFVVLILATLGWVMMDIFSYMSCPNWLLGL